MLTCELFRRNSCTTRSSCPLVRSGISLAQRPKPPTMARNGRRGLQPANLLGGFCSEDLWHTARLPRRKKQLPKSRLHRGTGLLATPPVRVLIGLLLHVRCWPLLGLGPGSPRTLTHPDGHVQLFPSSSLHDLFPANKATAKVTQRTKETPSNHAS